MIFVSVGSSIGEAESTFAQAEFFLTDSGVRVIKKSSILKNPAVGGVAQNDFSNAVWQVDLIIPWYHEFNWVLLPTRIKDRKKAWWLLRQLQQCENHLGRVREKRWDDRTLDLDILQFGDLILDHPKLTIPHPEISRRLFVLVLWQEIVDGSWVIPRLGKLKNLSAKLKP